MHSDSDTGPELARAALAAQVEDFVRLAHWYADHGDSRRAVLATWAADVRTVQHVLWDEVHTTADAVRALGTLGETVVGAVSAGPVASATSLRDVVLAARQAMVSGLDASMQELLHATFVGLDHLDALATPAAGAANEAVAERLAGRAGEQLVGDLLGAATDSRLVAGVMAEVGDADEARRQQIAATLAAFEAYLVLSSAASGDATLATTDLRWDLASLKADADALEDPARLREAITTVVAPAEVDAMLAVLDLPSPVRAGA